MGGSPKEPPPKMPMENEIKKKNLAYYMKMG
jgi:hypothetical protein